jgi:hypothetical protein
MDYWQEKTPAGETVGRDPRKMTPAELERLGHRACSVIDALRRRCLDCCAGSAQEVRYCVAKTCPSWPFRMGKNPWVEKRQLSEDQREAARERMRVLVEKRTQNAAKPDEA